MKSYYHFCGGFCFGAVVMMALIFFHAKPIPKDRVMNSPYFEIDGKEWQCGFTPRQVEINLLEDKIQKLKQ